MYSQRAAGEWLFQIQSAKPESVYEVELVGALSSKAEIMIKDFQPSLVPAALESIWSPDPELEFIGYWRLKRDGDIISPPLSKVKFPEKFLITNAKLSRRLDSVVWQQSGPALSRVFVANRSGMLVDWVSSWQFAGIGAQQRAWDFLDNSKVRSYRSDSDLHAMAQTIPLGRRWIVVGTPSFTDQLAALDVLSAIDLPKVPYDFSLSVPEVAAVSLEELPGQPVFPVAAGTALRVMLDQESREKIGGRRFEILLYLNGEFIHEEAQGVDPYTFILPHFEGVKGLQYFTVNIIDYHGNIASQSIAIDYRTKNP